MKKGIAISLAMAMATTMTQALDNFDTVEAGNWTAAGVWPGDGQPDTNSNARLKHDVSINSVVGDTGGLQTGRGAETTLTINSGGFLKLLYGSATIGGNNRGHLVLNGGSLTTANGNVMNIGTKAGFGGSSVTVNSGGLTVDGAIKVGAQDWAILAINGGTVSAAGNLLVGAVGLAASSVDLLGGSLSVDGSLIFGNTTDTLNIENDAVMMLSGDDWADINAGIAAGNITWANGDMVDTAVGLKTWDNGSGSYLHTDFDGSDTTVWVNQTIPEPATLGLIGFAGAVALIIRRRFLI
ncbi:PEP-CTERM sorting domain-containing protein [Pontiella sulfatireligans]|uniref:Ice-binding protein C-terminal domain-containing protein n=1 Tax=Pontiella sulfatireligans TaxID=2750658 RepID=A0A6C2UN53_9BACT|nr:PEP-CTERM sorting domain-containing protein [Pontiella sulfatireligans]VGO20711.1 hypothetical protein SCARR_02778 [Pontiella sulfatireligans]